MQSALAALRADEVTAPTRVVNQPLLDVAAAESFRKAAVRLSRQQPDGGRASDAARDAAQALVSLAQAKDEGALRQFLLPDPREPEATWTVACYHIGDLTPCALLDFADPVAAVNTLAHCGDASHVAAELVASTSSGTRWTALTRTGRDLNFQLPDRRSASAAQDGPAESTLPTEHWLEQLTRWSRQAPQDMWADAAPAPPSSPGRRSPRPTKNPAAPVLSPSRGGDDELEQALAMVGAALRKEHAAAQAVDHPNEDIMRRLDALDRRMSKLQATLEAALDRRIQALASYTVDLARAFTTQQAAATSRIEARLDDLIARSTGGWTSGAGDLGAEAGPREIIVVSDQIEVVTEAAAPDADVVDVVAEVAAGPASGPDDLGPAREPVTWQPEDAVSQGVGALVGGAGDAA